MLMLGGGTARSPSGSVVDSPEGFLTTTSKKPAVKGGVVAVMSPDGVSVTPVAGRPPMLTVVPVVKLCPLRVSNVPPRVGPLNGLTELTMGDVT